MPNLSFRGQCELSTDLQLPQKDQNHIAISNCCQARSQVGPKGADIPEFLTARIELSNSTTTLRFTYAKIVMIA